VRLPTSVSSRRRQYVSASERPLGCRGTPRRRDYVLASSSPRSGARATTACVGRVVGNARRKGSTRATAILDPARGSNRLSPIHRSLARSRDKPHIRCGRRIRSYARGGSSASVEDWPTRLTTHPLFRVSSRTLGRRPLRCWDERSPVESCGDVPCPARLGSVGERSSGRCRASLCASCQPRRCALHSRSSWRGGR
jgi:hypothetical protein